MNYNDVNYNETIIINHYPNCIDKSWVVQFIGNMDRMFMSK